MYLGSGSGTRNSTGAGESTCTGCKTMDLYAGCNPFSSRPEHVAVIRSWFTIAKIRILEKDLKSAFGKMHLSNGVIVRVLRCNTHEHGTLLRLRAMGKSRFLGIVPC